MRLGILSRENNPSTLRLVEAAEQRGLKVRRIDTLRVTLLVVDGVPTALYRGKPLELDAVIPRIGPSVTLEGAAVVRQLERMGVHTPTPSKALIDSRDKLRSMQVLATHTPMPPTAFVQSRSAIVPTIERLGGLPVVVKVVEGMQGHGVILAESAAVAEAIVETLRRVGQPVILQKYIEECRGRDVRVFVAGGRVVASARRIGRAEEYRSNVHRGGRAEPVTLPQEAVDVAVKAAEVLGLGIAGVDLLEARDGPLLMEVNSSPGIGGMEEATGVDIAGAVVDHVIAGWGR